MQIQITPEQRQKLMQHADYPKMMGEAVAAIKVDELSIPDEMHEILMRLLAGIPLPAITGMDLLTYSDIIEKEPKEYGIGVLQKACDLITSKEPDFFNWLIGNVFYNKGYMQSYVGLITPYHTLFSECTRLLTEARDNVTNKLWTREKIAGK